MQPLHLQKIQVLKFGIGLTETKDACTYLWTRDKIEKLAIINTMWRIKNDIY